MASWGVADLTDSPSLSSTEGNAESQERAVDEQGRGKPEGHQLPGGSKLVRGALGELGYRIVC